MTRWRVAWVVAAVLVALSAWVYAQPAPNNCGLNMDCRIRNLFVSGTATFSGGVTFADAGFGALAASSVTTPGVVSAGGFDGGTYTNRSASGDGVTFDVDAVEIQWLSANANIRGNASGVQTAGTFTAGGEAQVGTDGYRVTGTGVWDSNAHAADGTTGYTWDRSVDLTSGLFGCWRANGNTALTCLSWAGNVVLRATDSTGSPGAATINKPCGKSAVAAGASSVVITNSTVAATSIVFVTPLSSSVVDCAGWRISTIGAGSFTLTCPAGNTVGAWNFQWCVHNTM